VTARAAFGQPGVRLAAIAFSLLHRLSGRRRRDRRGSWLYKIHASS
jgi:hypothetical protein